MTTRRGGAVAAQVRALLAIGSASGQADGQLLARFAGGDAGGSALAFEALVDRHGPMVLRVCLGVLRDPHDAQDAFQATFLVLVRKAGSIRDRDSVASWLHGVALRVARRARAESARRRRLEREALERAEAPTTAAEEDGDDLGPRLHEEVARLPGRYRAAVVLCYLEGHTCEDAARALGWPVGTLKSRLSRARERLRGRLARPGTAPLVAPGLARPIPPRLARTTADLAAQFAARSPTAAAAPAAGAAAVALAEGALRVMTLAKLRPLAFALLAASSGAALAPALWPPARTDAGPTAPVAREGPPAQAQAPGSLARTTPRDPSARAGSGSALIYALDPKGGRIPDADAAGQAGAARREALRAATTAKGMVDASNLPRFGQWKEVEAELRWVALTAVVDNQGVREALALERDAGLARADPSYKRVDVERQSRKLGGAWSGWAAVDQDKNYAVLDNLPTLDAERMPESARLPALVDPLPRLTKGAWAGIDPESLLQPAGAAPDGLAPDDRRADRSPRLAIRFLDFTVEPKTSYCYRLRVVLANPDAPRDGKKELMGPWSEPTGSVVAR